MTAHYALAHVILSAAKDLCFAVTHRLIAPEILPFGQHDKTPHPR
jgi:hypothetical protein